MNILKSASLSVLTLALTTSLAFAAAHGGPAVSVAEFSGETFLIDQNKMTLYTFDNDSSSKSNCNDECAVKWPPLAAAEGMGLPQGYMTITRDDGSLQIAYKGQPLYLWFKDENPTDMTGDGVKGVWHVARP